MDTELEEKLTQLGEQLGATGAGLQAFVRGRDRSTYRDYLLTHDRDVAPLAESDRMDRERLGRERYGLSGLALRFFVENAPPIAKPQEAKRPKPKGQPAPQNVKLREADGTRVVYASDGSVLYRDHTTQRTQETKRPAASKPKGEIEAEIDRMIKETFQR